MSGSSSEVRIMPVQSSFRRSMTGRCVQPNPRISAILHPPVPRLLRRGAALLAMTTILSLRAERSNLGPYGRSLCVVGVPIGVAQHAAGQCAGMLAFVVQHLAVDDCGEDPFGRLLDAPGALREVADDDLVAAFHGSRI